MDSGELPPSAAMPDITPRSQAEHSEVRPNILDFKTEFRPNLTCYLGFANIHFWQNMLCHAENLNFPRKCLGRTFQFLSRTNFPARPNMFGLRPLMSGIDERCLRTREIYADDHRRSNSRVFCEMLVKDVVLLDGISSIIHIENREMLDIIKSNIYSSQKHS